MSLSVDWSKVEPKPTEQEIQSTMFSVGTAMSVLGIPKLETMADVQEIMLRLKLYDGLFGSPLLQNAKGESLNTQAFWRRWANIRINVVKETRAAFTRRMTKSFYSEQEYKLRQEF